jgi:hypothetical protein
MAIVKNLAKDGRYYWVLAEIESRVDSATSEIEGLPRSVIDLCKKAAIDGRGIGR